MDGLGVSRTHQSACQMAKSLTILKWSMAGSENTVASLKKVLPNRRPDSAYLVLRPSLRGASDRV